jgi:IrrE N-terminal-like domain
MSDVSSRSVSPGQISMLEYLRAKAPLIRDEVHIRELAERLLDEGAVKPPVDVELLASLRGIVDVAAVNQPWAGMLATRNGRFLVSVRADDSYERQRFTILHEAIHTYCPGFLEAQFRCNPNESEGRVEALCDHGASELLLPRRFFGPELTDLGLTIDTLIELAPRYVASVEATGIRAVDLWQGPASLLVFRNRHKPSDAGTEDAEPKLRLDWSHTSGRWPYLRRYKSVSDGSPFADAMLGEVVERVSNLAELTGDADRLYQVSARAMGRDRVLALVHPMTQAAA